jgi:hypothetical protein
MLRIVSLVVRMRIGVVVEGRSSAQWESESERLPDLACWRLKRTFGR